MGKEGWSPKRNEAYLGVLVDDLITRGVTEPYRMFTSRAEYRLSLREDNADMRLTEIGRQLGIVDDARWDAFNRKRDAVAAEIERLKSTWVNSKTFDVDTASNLFGKPLEREYSLLDLLKRPEMNYPLMMTLKSDEGEIVAGPGLDDNVAAEQVEIQVKYAGYVAKQMEEVKRQAAQESQLIPADIDYDAITSLSIEVRQRLKASRPETVGQASRVSGVTPAAISLLLIHIKRMQYRKKAA
jgi:tRNA uridine 5-carboxymethylaminomethyl modification enzyme